jgi:hypothetical protein
MNDDGLRSVSGLKSASTSQSASTDVIISNNGTI